MPHASSRSLRAPVAQTPKTPDRAATRTQASAGPGAIPASDESERIRRRAYEIYESRRAAGRDGNPIIDWLQAERECSARTNT